MRRIERALQEYEKRFSKVPSKKGGFYMNDFYEVVKLSGCDGGNDAMFETVFNALQAWFMIGYRCAKAEARRKNNA